MTITHHTRPVNGIRLHTVEAGPPEAPVLVFLHGFPENWYGWHRQIDYFAGLGYRVVVPDQRGYNLSDKPGGVSAYAPKELVRDAAELIRSVSAEKVGLVGHDWGGIVAWLVAELHPDLLHKLVILNVPHPRVMLKTLRSSPKQVLKSWYAGFFQLPWLPERLLEAANFAPLVQALRRTSRPGTFSTEHLRRYREAWRQPGALTGMINWYRAMRHFDRFPPSDGPIRVPTCLIWGTKDVALSREMVEPSAERCQQATVHFFEDATHWVQHEKSAEVNELIRAFIQS